MLSRDGAMKSVAFALRGMPGKPGGGAAHAALIELRRIHLERLNADQDLIDIQRHGEAQAQRRLPFTRDDVAQGRSDRRRIDRVRDAATVWLDSINRCKCALRPMMRSVS